LDKIKNKIIVLSGKGGVGKTSVSVNLSIALAYRGFKVGLMDVDIHGPDVPRMLGLKGVLGINENKKLVPMPYSGNLAAVSVESLVAAKDDAIIWRGPIKHSAIRQFISDVDWGDLDYLIIDSPPGTGDEPLSVAQVVKGAKAIIVTTPQEVSLADVRKSISFCRTVKMEIVGLVENMSGYICPHCQKPVDLFGIGGGERTAQTQGLDFLGRIPFDPQLVACGDAGVSYQEKFNDSPVTAAFSEIADKLSKKTAGSETTTPVKVIKEAGTMKFAIPIADGKLAAHFGHCKEFAIIDVQNNEIKNKVLLEPPPHEPGVLPKWLHDLEADVIIAGGMGQKAQSLFIENEIQVVIGAPSTEPEKLVMDYLNNTLVTGANICDH
jgi:Mrp family chromosome partitioning ATPase/predicted Fe-Mo cluster-binding NifX family protein